MLATFTANLAAFLSNTVSSYDYIDLQSCLDSKKCKVCAPSSYLSTSTIAQIGNRFPDLVIGDIMATSSIVELSDAVASGECGVGLLGTWDYETNPVFSNCKTALVGETILALAARRL